MSHLRKFKCPKGQKRRFRTRRVKGGTQRIGGCAVKGRFVKVREVTTIIKGRRTITRKLNN